MISRTVTPYTFLAGILFLAVVTVSTGMAIAQDNASSEAGWGEMTAERRAEAVEYSNTKNILYFVEFIFGALVWIALLFTGFSSRILAWAERVGKKRFFVLLLYVLALIGIIQLASLPLEY